MTERTRPTQASDTISRANRKLIAAEVTGRLPRIKERAKKHYITEATIRDVAALFPKDTLIKLTQDQRQALKCFYLDEFYIGQLSTKSDYIRAFRGYEGEGINHSPGSRKDYGGHYTRLFDQYVKDALDRKPVIEVADFGAAQCEFISAKKHALKEPSKMRVTATSKEYYPHKPVDEYTVCIFEQMPKSFAERFDVTSCHIAFQYSPLPHLALENIARTLAPGGRGLIQYTGVAAYANLMEMTNYHPGNADLYEIQEHLKRESGLERIPKGVHYLGRPQFNLMLAQANTLLKRKMVELEGTGFEVGVGIFYSDKKEYCTPRRPGDWAIDELNNLIHISRPLL